MQFALVDESGVVLSLEPSVADRMALAPDGTGAQSIHMSLASLAVAGGTDQATDLAALLTAILPLAGTQAPLTGTTLGTVTLDGGAGSGYLFDVDGLDTFLQQLASAVEAAGTALTSGEQFVPMVRLPDGVTDAPFSGAVTFDGLGVRYNGQLLLVPLSGVAPAASAEPTEAPVTDPAAPAPEAAPAPAAAAIAPADVMIGLGVTWTDPDGTARTGVIVAMDGVEGNPPSATVLPADAEDDPANYLELPLDTLDVAAAADAPADAPEVAPEGEAPEGDVPDAVAYRIEADHPDCLAEGDGTASVAVVRVESGEDGEEIADVESCWLDEAAAQAHIDDLIANGDPDVEEPGDAAPLFAVGEEHEETTPVPVSLGTASVQLDVDTTELERAAAMAEQIQGTLNMLADISPDRWGTTNIYVNTPTTIEESVAPLDRVGDLVASGPAIELPLTVGEVSELAQPIAPVVMTGPAAMLGQITFVRPDGSTVSGQQYVDEKGIDLADVTEEDLVGELARRWAEDLAAELTAPTEEPTVEPETAVTEDPVEAAVPAPSEPEPVEAVVEPVTNGALGTAFSDTTYELEGILIVEGMPSGDNRMIAEGALISRELPLPLMLQTVNAPGHDGSVIAGSIHEIIRDGANIRFRGNGDSGPNGREAVRLLSEGTMRGISADIDSVVVEFLSEDGQPVSAEDVMFNGVYALEVLVEGRIMGGTLTPFPAFQEAQVQVISSTTPDEAMVASGLEYRGDVWRASVMGTAWLAGQAPTDEALVASGGLALVEEEAPVIPVAPPAAWFGIEPGEGMTADQNFTVYPDGRCYGLVAKFGTCHIGFSDRCVPVPRSKSKYGNFRVGTVLTEEGTLVKTGTLFMDTDHAELGMKAVPARDHYAHTGCAVADVAMYDTEHGVLAAGAMRSDLSPEKQRAFRASQPSPDWRKINGSLDAVGLLAVNTSGFIVESLVASGVTLVPMFRGRFDSVTEEVTALVASGFAQSPAAVDDRDATIASLREAVEGLHSIVDEFILRPVRAERAAAAMTHLSTPTSAEAERAAQVEGLLARFGPKAPAEFVATFEAEVPGCGGACGGHDGACACEVPASPEA